MTLADTSVWIDFFKRGSARFARVIDRGEIVMHSVVLGELATGNLSRRSLTLSWLRSLPRCSEASVEESLGYIEMHRLYGRGLGWNDVQLLASAQLAHAALWSLDVALATASSRLHLAYLA